MWIMIIVEQKHVIFVKKLKLYVTNMVITPVIIVDLNM